MNAGTVPTVLSGTNQMEAQQQERSYLPLKQVTLTPANRVVEVNGVDCAERGR